MARRRSQPSMTGPDYLMAAARSASDGGRAYADDFSNMLWAAFVGDPGLLSGAIGRRPLNDYEAAPVAIILGAFQLARSNQDVESAIEVLQVGMALLAKWPEYLDGVADGGHPALMFRPSEA